MQPNYPFKVTCQRQVNVLGGSSRVMYVFVAEGLLTPIINQKFVCLWRNSCDDKLVYTYCLKKIKQSERLVHIFEIVQRDFK